MRHVHSHHHHRESHPFMRHGGRGRGGRMFDQGDLRWIVLQLISEQPRHGYEIIKEIEARMGGGYSPSPGVIYPTLTLLEEMGYAAVDAEDGGRKLYRITEEGAAQLAAERASVDALMEKMSHARARSPGAAPAPVLRAAENLQTALRLKLQAGPLGDETARAVAEALDLAAVTVERA